LMLLIGQTSSEAVIDFLFIRCQPESNVRYASRTSSLEGPVRY
jgi:hypothetical protein